MRQGSATLHVMQILGFAALFSWMQATDFVVLTHDPLVYNSSIIAASTFVIALAVVAFLWKPLCTRVPSELTVVVASLAAAIFGIIYLSSASKDAQSIGPYCAQIAFWTILIVAWGERVPRKQVGSVLADLCASGILSALYSYWALNSVTAWGFVTLVLLPLVCGTAWVAARRTASRFPEESYPLESRRSSKPERRNNSSTHLFLITTCGSAAIISVFIGLALNPFMANSSIVFGVCLITNLILLTIVLCAAVILCRKASLLYDGIRSEPDSSQKHMFYYQMRERGITRIVSYFMLTSILILLIAALLVYATKLAGTMMPSLGVIVALKACLMVVIWAFFPHNLAHLNKPTTPWFAILLLVSGSGWLQNVISWTAKVLRGSSFESQAIAALACSGAIAVLCLTNLALRERQAAVRDSESKPEPTMEDVRKAHEDRCMEAFQSHGLTEREREVARLLLGDRTTTMIAKELFISESTVKFHSKNVYEKLGVQSKKELIQLFAEM